MKIKYLTWLQEKTGKHEDHLNLPKDVETIGCLITYLENNKSECAAVFKNRSVIYTAVNNEIQQQDHSIKNTDEVSFFSAIVGG